jgi:hypothetical protein
MKSLIYFVTMLLLSQSILTAQTFGWADVVFLAGRTENASDNEIYTATDADGNIFVTGKYKAQVVVSSKYTSERTGNEMTSTVSITSKGGNDIFLAKFDRDGVLEWVHSFGSTGEDLGKAIAINSQGDIIITGTFEGTVDFAGISLTSSRKNNIFIALFNKQGIVQWAQRAGGITKMNVVESGTALAIDAADNIYLTGTFFGADDSGNYSVPGKATFGAYEVKNAAQSTNSFAAKYTKAGTVEWVQVIPHYGKGGSYGICLDPAGNTYITGECSATFVFGSQVMNSNGISDIYVAKFGTKGECVWFKQFGSGEKFNPATAAQQTDPFECGTGICSDAQGNLYVTGQFSNTCKFGTFELESEGYANIFIMKMNGEGEVQWATRTGGEFIELSKSICLDTKGYLYIAGANSDYGGMDSEEIGDWVYSTPRGLGFVEKYSADKGEKEWGEGAGSFGLSLACDKQNQVYLVGSFANQVKFGGTTLDIKGKLLEVEDHTSGWFTSHVSSSVETYEGGFGLYMVKILE